MMTNCFRFAPRDSVPGLIAKICKYLKDHPGWSEEEIEEQIKQFIRQTGVESFNGRTGDVVLNEDDVNNLKIAYAYFAEGDETIDELDIADLYNHGVRFVFTNWNAVTSGYDSAFVLEYFSGSNDVVYYPIVTGSGGGNIVSVNGKTGIVELTLSDILGDSGAQVKLCTATEFTSNTIATWNAYYKNGYRLVCVVNDESTAVDFMYVLKQDVNNHQPIMISSGSSESVVTSVNTMTGDVQIPVVDVADGDSDDAFAKIFINENEDYPVVPSHDTERLGGHLPSYYATHEFASQLAAQIVAVNNNKLGKTEQATDSAKLDGKPASDYLLKDDAYDMELLYLNPATMMANGALMELSGNVKDFDYLLFHVRSLSGGSLLEFHPAITGTGATFYTLDLATNTVLQIGIIQCIINETTIVHSNRRGINFTPTPSIQFFDDAGVFIKEIYGVKGAIK